MTAENEEDPKPVKSEAKQRHQQCIARSSLYGPREKPFVRCRVIEQKRSKEKVITIIKVEISPETETCELKSLQLLCSANPLTREVLHPIQSANLTIQGLDGMYPSDCPFTIVQHGDIISYHHTATDYYPKKGVDTVRKRLTYCISRGLLPSPFQYYYSDSIKDSPSISQDINKLTHAAHTRDVLLSNLRLLREKGRGDQEKNSRQYRSALKDLAKLKMKRQVLIEEHIYVREGPTK
eukprot:TRINITY_DN2364_c4_g1_i1.p1 TRINITY_DN2364_c4_g1~~TRINITY_DN2364_c4_g1_i1.p1  ORF type:complete len:258 (+),score=33.47 TRINITY_DN2364_c4_g1_i1:65-775(+)